ncbi:FtsX-like permease family protein [Candidatus Aerophobetes bacterium]|uniref:FtsX-like permease family protein n=1 Tax=Aerophobetes bacterium TaxID=2030807 RepID=A0A523QL85_UNCAE|nr:MAG: FtsX-like permease family protein [Candidatus Aerophobetes bacterium]
MKFTETFGSALDGLRANRTRAFLSMLGIIIGIAAVIIIISITQGSQRSISERIQALGTNLINVSPGRRGGFAGMRARAIEDVFTLEDGEKILAKASAVKRVVPVINTRLLLQYQDRNVEITVNGVSPEYQEVLNFWVEEGRFIDSRDLRSYRTVIVLGEGVANDLFEDVDPLGQSILVNGPSSRYKFRVIGVMQPKGRAMFFDFDDQAFIPITTAQKRLLHTRYVESFSIQAESREASDEAIEQIDAILYQKFQDDTKYRIFSQEELLSTMSSVMQTFTIMLVGIAGISLLVGGIGIMNTMLGSVTERTREIGTRMAVGAKRSDILLQFLWESMVLCLVGGVIGIVAGWIGSTIIASIAGWATVVSFPAVALALGFATVVGLFFGIYPANKASKLDPVEALRYE